MVLYLFNKSLKTYFLLLFQLLALSENLTDQVKTFFNRKCILKCPKGIGIIRK
jgi:hypothetical protein